MSAILSCPSCGHEIWVVRYTSQLQPLKLTSIVSTERPHTFGVESVKHPKLPDQETFQVECSNPKCNRRFNYSETDLIYDDIYEIIVMPKFIESYFVKRLPRGNPAEPAPEADRSPAPSCMVDAGEDEEYERYWHGHLGGATHYKKEQFTLKKRPPHE